ncbi:sodium:solute symporter family protein [Oscillospiraceae bacterium OttesenSCG-928-F05]|nr:sodium:solute symporter family protein [Oscillospiraceae bacterium OttesenSCG-928-F05]
MVTTLVLLGLYASLLVFLGIYSAKHSGTLTAFLVGGRSAGSWVSAFAYGSSFFSAVVFVGYAGRNGWDMGLYAVLIGVGNALIGTYLAWRVLGERTRRVSAREKIKTLPGYFATRFQSPAMRTVAALIIFCFLLPYSASVYSGLSYMSEAVLGLDYALCMLFLAGLTAFYVVLGGYRGSVLVDTLQGIVMTVVLAVILFNITRQPELSGFAGAFRASAEATAERVNLFGGTGPNLGFLISMILLTSFGTWGLPQTLQKFFGIRDKKAVRRGASISAVFSLFISGGAYFIGALSQVLLKNPPVDAEGAVLYDLIVPVMLQARLPELLLSLLLVLLFAASMSTLSGLTLSASSALSMDLIRPRFEKAMTEKRTLLLTRVFCVLFIAASYLIAYFKLPIIMLMGFSWGAVAGAFLGPFLLSLFWKRTTKAGAFSGMLSGLVFTVAAAVLSGFNAAYSSYIGVIAMALGLVATWGVSLVTKPLPAAHVARFFEFEPEGEADARRTLKDRA